MNSKTEGTLAILAALLVLFSAMWDPRVSVGVSILALLGGESINLCKDKIKPVSEDRRSCESGSLSPAHKTLIVI